MSDNTIKPVGQDAQGSGHSSIASSIGSFFGRAVTSMAELPVQAAHVAASAVSTVASAAGSVASKVADATSLHAPKDSYAGGQQEEEEETDGVNTQQLLSQLIGPGADGATGGAAGAPEASASAPAANASAPAASAPAPVASAPASSASAPAKTAPAASGAASSAPAAASSGAAPTKSAPAASGGATGAAKTSGVEKSGVETEDPKKITKENLASLDESLQTGEDLPKFGLEDAEGRLSTLTGSLKDNPDMQKLLSLQRRFEGSQADEFA